MSKQYTLSMNGDAFNGFKLDFDAMLNKLLYEMQSRDCKDATVTMKMTVSLEPAEERNMTTGVGTIEVAKPTFKHEISAVMQVRDKKSGFLSGNYKLVFDKEQGKFIIQEIDDGQQTMEDYVAGNTPNGEAIDVPYREVDAVEALPTAERPMLGSGSDKPESVYALMLRHVSEQLTVNYDDGDGTVTLVTMDGVTLLHGGDNLQFYPPENISAERLLSHVGHTLVMDSFEKHIVVRCLSCDEDVLDIYEP